MKLFWVRLFEKVGENELQENYVEKDHQFVKRGRIYKRCEVCKRWVLRQDYYNFCRKGYHELSTEADLKGEMIPEAVEKLSETQI